MWEQNMADKRKKSYPAKQGDADPSAAELAAAEAHAAEGEGEAAPEEDDGLSTQERSEDLRETIAAGRMAHMVVEEGEGEGAATAAEGEGEGEGEPVAEGEGTLVAAPAESVITIKGADGKERQIPLSEAQRIIHDYETIDGRLQKAEHLLADVQRVTAQPASALAAEGEGGPPADPLENFDFAGVAKSMQFDAPEEAGEKLKNLVVNLMGMQAANQPVDVRAITAQAVDHLSFVEATRHFGEDFPDLLEDKSLAEMAGRTAFSLIAADRDDARKTGRPPADYAALFTAAGKATQDWVSNIRGAQPEAEPTAENQEQSGSQPKAKTQPGATVVDLPGRTERKVTASSAPPGRSAAAAGAPAIQREQTEAERRSSAIADIQKGRGQATG